MSNSKIDLILKQLLELNAKISNLEKENTYLKAQLGVKTSEKQVKKGLNKIASEYKSKPGTGAESINIKFKKKPDPNTFKGYKLIEHYFKTGEQKWLNKYTRLENLKKANFIRLKWNNQNWLKQQLSKAKGIKTKEKLVKQYYNLKSKSSKYTTEAKRNYDSLSQSISKQNVEFYTRNVLKSQTSDIIEEGDIVNLSSLAQGRVYGYWDNVRQIVISPPSTVENLVQELRNDSEELDCKIDEYKQEIEELKADELNKEKNTSKIDELEKEIETFTNRVEEIKYILDKYDHI